jgi:hypothetical protein
MSNSNLKSTVSGSGSASYQMEAIMGLSLPPLDSRSPDGRLMWMEENVFSLSSSNFSIPWYLFYTRAVQ